MIDASKFEAQGKPTVLQVKAVWDAHPDPSARKIHELLEQRGFKISWRTVARYRKNNWLSCPDGKGKKSISTNQHTPAPINRAIDAALASLPPKQVEEANQIAATGSIERAINGGGALTDADYARIAARAKELVTKTPAELLLEQEKARTIMNIIVMEEATRKANIIALIPKDTGSFMADAAAASKALTPAPIAPIEGAAGPAPYRNGDGAKVIEGTASEMSPLSQAIRRIKAEATA